VFKKLLRTAILGSATLATALVLTCGPAGASTFWATSSYLIPRTSCTESASLVSHLDSAGHLLVQAEGRMPCTGRTASGTAFTITTWAQWWYNSQLQGYDSPASASWGGNTYGTGQYVYDSTGITFLSGQGEWVRATTLISFGGTAYSLGSYQVTTRWMYCDGTTKTCSS
jgi:hypothetical protein